MKLTLEVLYVILFIPLACLAVLSLAAGALFTALAASVDLGITAAERKWYGVDEDSDSTSLWR